MPVIFELEGRSPRIAASAFIAPNAVLVGDVDVGENASVWFGAVLRADFAPIRIGPGCSIQDDVVAHADAPGADWVALAADEYVKLVLKYRNHSRHLS
jgi:carbonic anhydrase/acetyltransferase-like protein (isoleucine patch superfamily)